MKHYYEVHMQHIENMKEDLKEIATSNTLREEDDTFFIFNGNLYGEDCLQRILTFTDIIRGIEGEKLLFKLNDYKWFMNHYNKN